MAYESFTEWKPSPKSQRLVQVVNNIVSEWRAMNYSMTLRQIYYQLVSRNVIPNTIASYKNLSALLKRARMAGIMDWDSMEDRTRNLNGFNYSRDMSTFLHEKSYSYHLDRWAAAEHHVEVWVEKDALRDIVGQACNKMHVDYLSCRGYLSATAVKTAADRFKRHLADGKKIVILHLGDHDPSGLDMSRDMEKRLLQMGAPVDFQRIALSMEQVKKYKLPNNPAKITDVRAKAYIDKFGQHSWELDALRPDVLTELILSNIKRYLEPDLYDAAEALEIERRQALQVIGSRYEQITEFTKSFDELADPAEISGSIDELQKSVTELEADKAYYSAAADEAAKTAEQCKAKAARTLDDLREEKEQRKKEVKLLTKQLKQAQTLSQGAGAVLDFPAKTDHLYTKGKQQRIYRGAAGDWALWSVPSKPEEVKAGSMSKARKWFEQSEEGDKHEPII